MAVTAFSLLPLGTRIRLAAVGVLKAAGTVAHLNIQDSPYDTIPKDGQPCINVFGMERRDGISLAGGRPSMRVQFTLQVQCLGIAALQTDAVAQADLMKQQVLDALLQDPVWPSLMEAIVTIEEKRTHGRDTERYVVDHLIAIQAGWRENYDQVATSVLDPTGMPLLPRQVIAPLVLAATTVVAGTPVAGEPTQFAIIQPLAQPPA